MIPFRVQLYGMGMMSGGYAAGMRMRGHDWTHVPWWGDLIFAAVLLVAAFIAQFRADGKSS